MRRWITRCDCWEHSDDLSKIYAQICEENPDWVLPWLEKWNRSNNPWERRQSVVGLLEYSQKRQKVQSFKTLISFVTPLLDDSEYYVQKGVGWTLREIFNIYPEPTLKYLQKHAGRIPTAGYQAATEKLSKPDKAAINRLRKQHKLLAKS